MSIEKKIKTICERFIKWLDEPSDNPVIHEFIQIPLIFLIGWIIFEIFHTELNHIHNKMR